MNLLAVDTETFLIGKGQNIPPLVCAQFATLEDGVPFPWIVEKARADYKEEILSTLKDDSFMWIFQNAAYDLSVLALEIPETLPLIWKTFDEDRIHDTMIREMLYNLTGTGDIDNIDVNGIPQRAEYSLAALTKKYTGKDRSADKDGEDSVRVNYEAVADLPLSEWPEEFVTYAEHDPADTLEVFLGQEIARRDMKGRTGNDPFAVESLRVKAHFALQLMTNRGNLLDKERVLEVTEEFDRLYNDPELVKPLVLSKFIEEFAEANGEPITSAIMEEAIEAYDALPAKEQQSWVGTGIVIPAVPPMPYKTGTKAHLETCYYHKDNPEYVGKNGKDCDCPVKMKGGQKEKGSDKALHKYIWKAALRTECMEVWASDSLKKKLKEEKTFEEFITAGKVIDQVVVDSSEMPEGWRVSVDKEWLATFALLDPLLEKLSIRRKYQKIITSYLPGLYWNDDYLNCPDVIEGETDRLAQKEPADVVHSCFRPLKRTGRTSSYANTRGAGKNKIYMFPSMNGQQVDPRIRNCIVPREGFKLFSIDYSAMELGTAAQVCRNLFGFSILGDVINSGKDSHSYLGMHIAQELDPWFRDLVAGLEPLEMYEIFLSLKKDDSRCGSPEFTSTWKATGHEEGDPTMADFYAHYRKFAKPTGLGYPGGLGPKTFVSYAKATYGVSVDLETAYKLRDIWKVAFPEMAMYLEHVSNRCFDPQHAPETREDEDGKKYKKTFYTYDTPLGMHRAKTDFCACANGQALQSPSAEGALLGVYEIMRDCYSEGSALAGHVFPTIFIHDEIFGEIRDDEHMTARVEYMQDIMKTCMEIITPDVQAGTEACVMNRWSKAAFPYFVDGKIRPYEEKLELDAREQGE